MTELTIPETSGSPAEAEALAVVAVDAIERVDDPAEAERLLRQITAYQVAVRLAQIGQEHEKRWAEIRWRAERKMGELLGPATPGRNPGESDRQSDSDYKQAERARKLAAVPQETFEEYISTAEEPTRAGLLRAAKKLDADAPRPDYATCPTCGQKVKVQRAKWQPTRRKAR